MTPISILTKGKFSQGAIAILTKGKFGGIAAPVEIVGPLFAKIIPITKYIQASISVKER